MTATGSHPQMVRLGETARPPISLFVDGVETEALEGDTLLVAVLTNGRRLRLSEFGDGSRAGFCLMGACQDCWVWTEDGDRLRACSTRAEQDMRIVTTFPGTRWPRRA